MPKTKMPQEICDLYLTNPSPNQPTIRDLAKKHDLDAKKITKFFQTICDVEPKIFISSLLNEILLELLFRWNAN